MENNKKNNVKKSSQKSVKNNNTTKKKMTVSITKDKHYKIAEKYFKNGDYTNAYKEYLMLSERFNKNKKIYKRLIECLTHNYTYKENNKAFKIAFDDYVTTYRILATKKELKLFEDKLSEYKQIKVSNSKSQFLIISFLGFFGIHRFIQKKYISGLLYLFTLGLFGIGVAYDLISDYVLYEDNRQVNILRYIISLIILLIGLLRINTTNFYYIILVAIIYSPFVYNVLLKSIPGIIKITVMIILCYLGFRVAPIVYYVPSNIIGVWTTMNENTNFISLDIKQDKTIIKFNDRKEVSGLNEYDSTNKVLSVYVSETNLYKFKIDLETNNICTYNDSKKCIISFSKNIKEK